jgi:hypothetical protein
VLFQDLVKSLRLLDAPKFDKLAQSYLHFFKPVYKHKIRDYFADQRKQAARLEKERERLEKEGGAAAVVAAASAASMSALSSGGGGGGSSASASRSRAHLLSSLYASLDLSDPVSTEQLSAKPPRYSIGNLLDRAEAGQVVEPASLVHGLGADRAFSEALHALCMPLVAQQHVFLEVCGRWASWDALRRSVVLTVLLFLVDTALFRPANADPRRTGWRNSLLRRLPAGEQFGCTLSGGLRHLAASRTVWRGVDQ